MIDSDIKVLIVEDHPITRDLVHNVIENLGYHISEVENGKDAIAIFESQQFDIVILDVDIGNPNGVEVCKSIRQKFSANEVVILFLSGMADEKTVVQGLKEGGDDYIKKPFSVPELAARIERHVEKLRRSRNSAWVGGKEFVKGSLIKSSEAEYSIVKKIAQGGMGFVFDGYRVSDNQRVAIKTLNPDKISNGSDIQRFLREAEMAKQVDHPNLVKCQDIIRSREYICYVMHYIEGKSLQDMVLPLAQSVDIIKQIARGLEYLHSMHLVHRDVKPGNIILKPDNIAVLVDLGLVKSSAQMGLTTTGIIMGTPEYLSPEQVSEQNVDIRSDIYSLGITLYRMLTGAFPFEGNSANQIMLARIYRPPVPIKQHLPDISPQISEIFDKVLANSPDDRYQTPQSLVDVLENLNLDE